MTSDTPVRESYGQSFTQEEIIKLAREVCAVAHQEKNRDVEYLFSVEKLERFAELVAAAKREPLSVFASTAESIFERIKHGDDEHKE